MITAKFGGTAVTPSNLKYLKQCITPFHKCVVVSAVGKEHARDVKTTDLLKAFYVERDDKYWAQITDKYRRLVEVNGVDIDVDSVLCNARERALNYSLEYCMSLGEELSAKVVSKYLSATYIEAEQIVRFGERSLRFKTTIENIRRAFEGVGLVVTGGFYGGDNKSRRIFSRGGSDITGSLCAVACNSSLYENWTDSYGVCVCNPAKIFDVATVDSLSYDEMFSLSRAGAEVLHPDAVKPCREHGIPIKIGNFYNPFGASTLVSNCPSGKSVLAVVEREDGQGNVVTTIAHNLSKGRLAGLLSGFFQENLQLSSAFSRAYFTEKNAIHSFACDSMVATITSNKSIVAPLYAYFKSQGIFA